MRVMHAQDVSYLLPYDHPEFLSSKASGAEEAKTAQNQLIVVSGSLETNVTW